MAAQAQWQLSGDYFENCNCSVVCPCLVSKSAPLTSRPTEGECNVVLIFHIGGGMTFSSKTRIARAAIQHCIRLRSVAT